MVPTAELTLDGALATPVAGPEDGIKHIIAHARRRRAPGTPSARWRCMRRAHRAGATTTRRSAWPSARRWRTSRCTPTRLAWVEAEYVGGVPPRVPRGRADGHARSRRSRPRSDLALFRLLVPLAKLTTGKQAVAVASEVARGVRRRRLRRGHGPAAPAARRAGAPHLGGDDERALARRAARALARRHRSSPLVARDRAMRAECKDRRSARAGEVARRARSSTPASGSARRWASHRRRSSRARAASR